MLAPLDTGQGFLKAGFLGFPGTGKTYTSALLASLVIPQGSKVAMFDTEGGSPYIAPMLRELCGAELVGVRSQSFDTLMDTAREVQAAGIPAFIVDSMTHVWRDVTDSYLREVNLQRKAAGRGPRNRREFQDWGPIKEKFKTWTDWYLNSPVHVLICGRAGYEYDLEKDEETGKKELVKTGTKMKTESEFGFEPSLLVEMERIRGEKILRTATVLKDRFGKIDGAVGQFGGGTIAEQQAAVRGFFAGHLDMLQPGAHSPIAPAGSTFDVDETGAGESARRRREVEIVLDEIKEEMAALYPGQSAEHKKARADMAEEVFGTRSSERVATLSLEILRGGLEKIRERRSK